jgi:hypothetical protein
MLKYAGDPSPRAERRQGFRNRQIERLGATAIPTVDDVNEVLAPGTAAVIWQIMRGDRYAGVAYRGADDGIIHP